MPTFAKAKRAQDAAFASLDKAMQAAVEEDEARMHLQFVSYISFMAARGKCERNRAFMKAARTAGLDGKR